MDTQEPNISFTIFFKLSKYSTSCIKTFHAQEHIFRNRMDLNDAVDANLILAAKNDHHECQSLQRINSIVVR